MLWLYQRTMFGKIENPKNEKLLDLNMREFATYAPLLVLAVWIGIYPAPFINRLNSSVNRVMARVNPAYAPQNANTTDCISGTGQVVAGGQGGSGSSFVQPPCETPGGTPSQAPSPKPHGPGGKE
jgi:hypothetical protein